MKHRVRIWRVEYLTEGGDWIIMDTFDNVTLAIDLARQYADDEECKTRLVSVTTEEQIWSQYDCRSGEGEVVMP